ncbi:MAG TPA: FtsQ-type POTRA domain-containing protein [Chloroflexota bacterium]|jgi:cell division septal protein FtsQ|nr:FtsQ-type POTRA domain-containing protein [Chloroflexota bacterium]
MSTTRRPVARPRPAAVPLRRGAPRPATAHRAPPARLVHLGEALRSPRFWRWCAAKLAALAVLAGSAALLYHFVTSTDFYVSDVVVEGNELARTQELVDAAAVSGSHILWLTPRQAAQRLRALPTVRDAEVELQLPNRAVLRVVERTPIAQWQVSTGSYLVDEEGRVLGPVGRRAPPTIVRESRPGPLQPGDRVPAEAVEAAVALAELLPAAWQPVTGVFDYGADIGISIATRTGWRVRFGDNEALTTKVATFLALAEEIERTGARAQLVDVRFPGRPYYR